MKRMILISLVLTISMSSFGQNSYYETKESVTSGVKIINGKQDRNFHICEVFEDGRFVRYSPDEVKQYRLKDGPEFFSREISISGTAARVFLERLVDGKSSLYYYLKNNKSYFFLEQGSNDLYLVPENEGRGDNTLADFLVRLSSDCPAMAETARSVKYRRSYLSNFIIASNSCDPVSFPRISYGVLLGLSTKRLIPSQNNSDPNLDYFDFTSEPAFSAGAFVKIPIALSDVSLQIELFYSQHKFSQKAIAEDIEFELRGELYAVKMPLMIRYRFPAPKFRPYVMAGPVLEYNLIHDFTLFQSPLTSEVVVIPESDYSVYMVELLKGIGAGAGLEFNLTGKHALVLEFRYDFLANVSAGSFINNSALNIMTGISF